MEGTEIGWTAHGTTFERANLTEAVLTGLDAAGASFEKAILNRAGLSRAKLVDARFRCGTHRATRVRAGATGHTVCS